MGGAEIVGNREKEYVCDVLDRKRLFRYGYTNADVHQSYAYRFEKAFAAYLNIPYCLAVSSGSAALRIALASVGLKPGSEVIVPAYTFVATLESVIEAGAKPVLAEVDESLNLDPADCEKRITPQTAAIIPVHMLGAAADMDPILQISQQHQLFVIEDACQAGGAAYRGQAVGNFGNLAAFSFDSAKLLTCSEGGMVATRDEVLYRKADRFHDHGHIHNLSLPRGKEPKEGEGFNFRLSELLAALGLAQLEQLPQMLAVLRAKRQRLMEIELPKGFRWRPTAEPTQESNTFLALLAPTPDTADTVKANLQKAGVTPATLNYWHYQVNVELAGGVYPRTEEYLARTIVLELKLQMTPAEVEKTRQILQQSLR